MDAFVAAPKTYIVERTADERPVTTLMPVVGWVWVQGTFASPITPLAFGGLTDKKAVLMPDGRVCDRFFGATFEDIAAWEHACDNHGPINRSGSPDPESVIEERPRAADELRESALKTAADIKSLNPPPARKPKKIKTLQQNSFWGKKDAAVILIAEGGTELPDDRDWMKITRDEFQTRKRDNYVVWPTEHGPGVAEAEVEQAVQAAQAQIDGDNFDDLV